jgi:hypothetical protein
MKMLAAAALAFTLTLAQFAGPTFANNGNGQGGHDPEQGAKPEHGRSGPHQEKAHGRGAEQAAKAHDKQAKDKDTDADATTEGEDEEEGDKVGVCHATGNGSYIFIRVSRHARGHLEHHPDDRVDVEDCPDTVAEED